jgi:hypothetical protein
MNRRILFADQSIEIGEAESTAAPMAVAPIKTNLRIVILPAKCGNDRAVILHYWNLDENKKNVLSAECVRSAVLSAVSVFAFLTSQFLHD